jgi:hypothetical protein
MTAIQPDTNAYMCQYRALPAWRLRWLPATGIAERLSRTKMAQPRGAQGAVSGSKEGLMHPVSQLSVEVTGEEPERAVGLERWQVAMPAGIGVQRLLG